MVGQNEGKSGTEAAMSLPDGPRILPLLHSLQWRGRFLEFLDYCVQRYGDPFTFRVVGLPPAIIVSHPQALKEIFTAPPGQFETGKANQAFRPLLGENSLLLLDGNRHQRRRRLLMPPFHGERLRTYGQLICDITQQEISQWPVNEPFVVRKFMQAITLRIILQVVFGIEQGQRVQQLRPCLSSLFDAFFSPFPWRRFSGKKQQVDELLLAEIQQRRQQVDLETADILTLLLAARDETGQPLTDDEVRSELMTLVLAGYETTATALAWGLYWITQLSVVRDKLLRELGTLNPHSAKSEIAQLPYLTAVCEETLRIYSITGFTFTRIVKAPLRLMGFQVEPGTELIPCIYLTHQRPELYPEPKQFKPERFLKRQFSPYEYLPFGGGNRACIGAAFAQLEMKLVLATILSHLPLSPADNRPIHPMPPRGLTIAPPNSLRMMVSSEREGQKTLVRL